MSSISELKKTAQIPNQNRRSHLGSFGYVLHGDESGEIKGPNPPPPGCHLGPPRNSLPYDQGLWKPLVSLNKVSY